MIIILFIISLNLYNQSKNIDIIDSLVKVSINDFSKSKNKFYPKIDTNLNTYLISKIKSEIYENDNIEINEDTLSIEIPKCDVTYYEINSDLIKRKIEYNFAIKSIDYYQNYVYLDTVLIKNIPYLEASSLDFDKTKLPNPKKGFFSKYLKPAIIIGSTLVSIILLFSIRSN